MDLKKIEKQIQKIKKELTKLGDIRPGSLSEQYNVCGSAGCKCKDPENPKKHGPYYKLSYVYKGKNSTQFIRPQCVKEIKKQTTNYKKLKELIDEWIGLGIEYSKIKMEIDKNKES
jgi:hypothetical protein